MTRIGFTSDWHVDEYGQRIDPVSGMNARCADFLRTAGWVCEKARDEMADALVIAGDLSERRHPSPWLVARIAEAIAKGPRLTIVTKGNHDGAKADRSIIQVLDQAERVVGVDRPAMVRVEDGAICALGYIDRHWLRAQPGFEHTPDDQVFQILSDQIVTIASGLYAQAKAAGVAWTVLVLHATLAGALMSETQQAFLGDRGTVVDAGRLAAIGFEAVVAGHLHRHQLLEGLACPVLYPGSIERVDFGEEHEAKGFVIADVGPGRFDWRFVETPARRFVTLTGEEIGAAPDDSLRRALDAVVRIVDLTPLQDPRVVREAFATVAFEVDSIRKRPVMAPESAGGMSEAMSPGDALETYFAGEPDAPALIEEGRRLLAEVSAA